MEVQDFLAKDFTIPINDVYGQQQPSTSTSTTEYSVQKNTHGSNSTEIHTHTSHNPLSRRRKVNDN